MTRRPALEDLDLLVRVAETGSLGRAAVATGVSQPSASRRIAALERSLRVTLLSRDARGSRLTTEGRLVVGWATQLLAAAEGFSRSVAALSGEREATLAVAVSMTIAEHHAPGWVARLHGREPSLRLAISVGNSTEVADRVEHGQADIGFLESPTIRASLRHRRFGDDRLVVAVAPGHPWAQDGRSVTVVELAAAKLLLREPGSGTRETLQHALERTGSRLTGGLEMASNSALRSAALQGVGPVVLSEAALADDLALGRLVRVPLTGLDLTRPLSVVWRPGVRLAQAARAFLQIVLTPA